MQKAIAILLALALTPTSVAAQDDSSPITVQGSRDLPTTTQRVRSIARSVDGTLPLFDKPVCPGVVGMPLPLAMGVIERMRDDLKRIGHLVAPEGCKPNLVVIFTAEGRRLVNELADHSPALFGAMSARQTSLLKDNEGPVWAWQTTTPKRADGAPVGMISQIKLGKGPEPSSKGAYVVPNASMSRLASSVRHDIDMAFVVISRSAIELLTLRQIADHAVMRGLMASRPGREVPDHTILTLFVDRENGHPPPDELTPYDRAFLAGVYSGSRAVTYEQKTRLVAQAIDRAGE